MKNVSLTIALLALTIFGSLGAAAQTQTSPTVALPAVALPLVLLPTPARHVHFELRDQLPGQPSHMKSGPTKSGPHPEETPADCNCLYGPPGSGTRVCGCYCDAGTACVPGGNNCSECRIYHQGAG